MDRPLQPQPQFPPNRHTDSFRERGLPIHAADLMWALDKGFPQLADTIYNIDQAQAIWRSQSPFQELAASLSHITNTLLCLSKPLLTAIIESKLHKLVPAQPAEEYRLPKQCHIDLPQHPSLQERPIIYTLVLCTKNGETPTKRELNKALAHVRKYCQVHEDDDQAAWERADQLALAIDEISPDPESGRDWIGDRAKPWSEFEHPRRYGNLSKSSRAAMEHLCEELTARLRHIPRKDRNKPLDWSVAYAGWTRREFERERQHRNHESNSSAVA